MAFTNSLTTNHPTGDTNPRDLDAIIRDQVKKAFLERLNVDHDFAVSGTTVDGADVGKHRRVSLIGAIATPSPGGEKGTIYGKLVDNRLELFYVNESGSEKQLTNNGRLNLQAADFGKLTTITDKEPQIQASDAEGLYIRAAGLHKGHLNADVTDTGNLTGSEPTPAAGESNSSLELDAAAGLRIKAGGVGTTELADKAVTAAKIKLPEKGTNALSIGIPVMATGNYTGDGSTGARTIIAFGEGVAVRHVTIARNNNVKMEAFVWNPSTGDPCAWNQIDNKEYGTDAISFDANKFKIYGTDLNNAGSNYYWIAYGVLTA